jgi:predicted Zn-dependent protease
MLIGHEVGHYLGLSHVSDAGNLMLASSSATDTNLNYDPQYRTIIRHGWVRID